MIRSVLAGLALVAGLQSAAAELACAPKTLEPYTLEAMTIDADLRAKAGEALGRCVSLAEGQKKNVGEVEDRLIVAVADLAGKLSAATYAADEIPQTGPALAGLLHQSFDPLYSAIRALPEKENVALMRSLVFHLAERGATGSIPR